MNYAFLSSNLVSFLKFFQVTPKEKVENTDKVKMKSRTMNLLIKYSFLLHSHLVKIPVHHERWSAVWRN